MEDQSFIHLAAEENRPLTRFEKCLPCPCNAGSCRLFTSTKKFAGRQFYRCPSPAPKQCKFFKWADLVEPHEFINVPYCGGCMSGVCRFRKVESGPNAGRILFMCTIKEGQGSCGFEIWQDDLEIRMGVAHQNISLFQSTFINCNDTGPAKSNVVVDCELSHKELDNESPLCDPLQHIQRLGTTSGTGTASGKMEQLKCQEDKSDESSLTPFKNLNGNIKGDELTPRYLVVCVHTSYEKLKSGKTEEDVLVFLVAYCGNYLRQISGLFGGRCLLQWTGGFKDFLSFPFRPLNAVFLLSIPCHS